MQKLTQHQKILNMCSSGRFVCQNEFRANYIFSPHKRRSEIEKLGYQWEVRPCEHNQPRQFDYKLISKGQLNLL